MQTASSNRSMTLSSGMSVRVAIRGLRRSAASVDGEPDLHRHLPVRDLPALHVAPGAEDLEPADVAYARRALGQGHAHGVVAAIGRRTGELDGLVDMLGHDALPGSGASSVAPGRGGCGIKHKALVRLRQNVNYKGGLARVISTRYRA